MDTQVGTLDYIRMFLSWLTLLVAVAGWVIFLLLLFNVITVPGHHKEQYGTIQGR